MNQASAIRAVRKVLASRPDLRQGSWRAVCKDKHPMCGHCYVGAEALYHLLGGKQSGCVPQNMQWEGYQHWFIKCGDQILDPTADQFSTRPDYRLAKGRGFLTSKPSKRAAVVIQEVGKVRR